MKYILSIDQGTTSSRAILFDAKMNLHLKSQIEFDQIYPKSGWVEHSGDDIWSTTIATCKDVLKKASIKSEDVVSIGITNQRETTLVWDKISGDPIYNAIVWQDRRTSEFCDKLKSNGHEGEIKEKTGLLVDPYFSASKLRWMLENVDGARERAKKGELLFGTVDTYTLSGN